MTGDLITCERKDGVALVTLNRPDKRNALSRALLGRLGELGRSLLGDESLRLVVVTGAGDRAFCAGADLEERAKMSDDEVRAQLAAYRTELSWLSDPRLPTLAALNGAALGGGLELALACDFRIAHESAVLGLVETSLGVIPGAGGTQRLPRIVGEAKAKELILLSRKLSANEALALGLVHAVVAGPVQNLVTSALQWAAPLLAAAPLATRAALAAIQAASELSLEDGLERELVEYEHCLTSEDRLEALRAFREKRPPLFRGK
jgi:methylglutaconyl-CoA hydratase